MTPKEYERLQARLTDLQNKKERQPSSGSNWRDGWKDAILAVKSMVHSEFKEKPKNCFNCRHSTGLYWEDAISDADDNIYCDIWRRGLYAGKPCIYWERREEK